MPSYIYEARIIDEDTGEEVVRVFAGSQEGLEEEMGKKKWTEAIERYEESERGKFMVDVELYLDDMIEMGHLDPKEIEKMTDKEKVRLYKDLKRIEAMREATEELDIDENEMEMMEK